MGQRWFSARRVNSSLPTWRAGRREADVQETEICFELMGCILLAQQQEVVLQTRGGGGGAHDFGLEFFLLLILKDCLNSLVVHWLESC